MIPLTTIKLIASLILPISVGYMILTITFRKTPLNIPLRLSLGLGLGFGILSHWMLILGILNAPLNAWFIAMPLLIILSITSCFYLRQQKNTIDTSRPTKTVTTKKSLSPTAPITPFDPFCIIAVIYITYIIVFVVWRSLNIPITDWDPVATSSFKAKIFFYDRSIHQLKLPHASYPLHVPFLQAWTAICLGQWNDLLLKIIFPITLIAYTIIHYSYLKHLTNLKWALGGVCLLLSSGFLVHQSATAYRDVTMMYYNCTTILLILLWGRTKDMNILLLSSLFAGFTTFVKLEGTEYLGVYTMICLALLFNEKQTPTRDKISRLARFVIPSYSMCAFYYFCKFYFNVAGTEGRVAFIVSTSQLSRLAEILEAFKMALFMQGNWYLIWLILTVSLIYNIPKIKKDMEIKLILLSLTMFFTIYIIFLTFTSAVIHYPTTLSRVILHFFPLAPLLITLINFRDKTPDEEQRQAPGNL